MPNAMKVGILYFAVIFTAGVGLGAVRVKLLEPNLGELTGLLIELPLILGASWIVCGLLIKRYDIPHIIPLRVAMGITAFVLLIAAELTLVLMAREIAFNTYLAGLMTLTGALGLMGQIAFATFPVLQR